ncbi:hypothetical protein GGS24DRAFT_501298 [Hypoxylon argillaceum]|nr:hypothetical protein GGS24DRAFT_501298 [Hypoxylon argillaceum]KAI1154886.1 hypothetical protein F4825DRAFT_448133 [Nemania diffusa]
MEKKLTFILLLTRFDTSHCLMNSNGQLSPSDSGDYWRSCKGCTARPTQNDFTINCTCLVTGVSGVRVATASYDLNRIVWNHDGYLGCFGHFGNKSERGPF